MLEVNRWAGWAAIGASATYLCAFVYFGAFWSYPADDAVAAKAMYLRDNQLPLRLISLLMYVGFGALLAVVVCALFERTREITPAMARLAGMFGSVWVGLMMATGMLATVGLGYVVDLSSNDLVRAMAIWELIALLVEAFGGGIEFVGGAWTLLVSIALLRGRNLPVSLSYAGVLVGLAGIATLYPAPLLTELFGVSQLIWFVWLGTSLLNAGTPSWSAPEVADPGVE